MSILKIAGYGAFAAMASLISIGSTQAAMAPVVPGVNSSVQRVDCAVGMHIGPAGLCIIGVDNEPPPRAIVVDPAPTVVEHNDKGCETKSINRTSSDGASETRTKSNCD
jgi:hypothetical protein